MNKINSASFDMSYILPEFELKACCGLSNVWVIGGWNLDIVCYLLFGAWSFFEFRNSIFGFKEELLPGKPS